MHWTIKTDNHFITVLLNFSGCIGDIIIFTYVVNIITFMHMVEVRFGDRNDIPSESKPQS